jgi:hypothetical protein
MPADEVHGCPFGLALGGVVAFSFWGTPLIIRETPSKTAPSRI